jgi:glycosyltransferase involved in cell wall biosynthesis
VTTALPRNSSLDEGGRIAVLIPCFNEETTISEVVRQFRAVLPSAAIYVFDNNSADGSVARARAAGATVLFERRQGKGYVVQSMFREVDADVYVMVDGDNTYPAREVEKLVTPIRSGEADMVIGSRLHRGASSQFRFFNRLGNRFFLLLLNSIFKVHLSDLLSGYRAFSRRLVRGMPLFGGGFETEAELTIKALQRGYRIQEVPIDLVPRPRGSRSKIRLLQDGFVILNTILTLFRDYKPLTFFGGAGLCLVVMGLIPTAVVTWDYARTGALRHLPAIALGFVLFLAGSLTVLAGLILHTIARRFQELDLQLQKFADDVSHRPRESARPLEQ